MCVIGGAYETYANVFPNRRGVDIKISDGVFGQPTRFTMSGLETAQSFLKSTLEMADSNDWWNRSWCGLR